MIRATLARVYSFDSQAEQYPRLGAEGIGYFAGDVGPLFKPVDCLLWRDAGGLVRGILNHYPDDYPQEARGNINLWVHPLYQRTGIATALLVEASRRWGPINLDQQRYTEAGAAFITKFLEGAEQR